MEAADIFSASEKLLNSSTPQPACIYIQAISNEAKRTNEPHESARKCLSSFSALTDAVSEKWPTSKIVIGLAPPRSDNSTSSTIQSIVNNSLRLLMPAKSVSLLELDDFGYNGYPDGRYYKDPVHFNKAGTSILASRIKRHIHNALGIKL